MADAVKLFFDKDTISATGTDYSQVFNTKDLVGSSLVFKLQVDTLSGSGSDTCDITIEESDQSQFSDSYRISTITTFTQVLGNSSAANIVNQRAEFTDNTTDRYIRAKRVIANTAATFSQKITVKLLAEEKV